MSHRWAALCAAYAVLGFEPVTQGDKVFRDLVLARIIEPTSKADALGVLAEVDVDMASYATVKRRLATMRHVINAFKAAHRLTEVTVVADAGMIWRANQTAGGAAGLSFLLGIRITCVPATDCRAKRSRGCAPVWGHENRGLVRLGGWLRSPWPGLTLKRCFGDPVPPCCR